MDDEEGELRAACIWTLGHFPVDKQTTEACIEALDDDYEWVVRYAIEALAHFGDLGALERCSSCRKAKTTKSGTSHVRLSIS